MKHESRATNHEPRLLPEGVGAQIALGRGALADRRMYAHHADWVRENGPVARLLTLLWHNHAEVRRSAALALPGGDRHQAYLPHYGHFANAFLRQLHERDEEMPANPSARHAAVVDALQTMMNQNVADIRGMSNMHYSFLGSALYLALLATCRDVTESIRRMRAAAVHPELCRLLWNLTLCSVIRRLNAQDADALTQAAGQALAAMSPDEIPEFWRGLRHEAQERRRAYAPVLFHLHDRRAVPHLLHALSEQPEEIAQPLIACLGRIGDTRALPALAHLAGSRNRLLRGEALAAIAAIRRADAERPDMILLRPVRTHHESKRHLLRPVDPAHPLADPPEQLLRPAGKARMKDEG